MISFFLILTALFGALLATKSLYFPRDGPAQLPIVGSAYALGKITKLHSTLMHLCRKYGGYVRLRLGQVTLFAIADESLLRKAFITHKNCTSARPPLSVLASVYMNSGVGIVFRPASDERYQILKRFSHSMIFGPGAFDVHQALIVECMEGLMSELEDHAAKGTPTPNVPEMIETHFIRLMVGVLWGAEKLQELDASGSDEIERVTRLVKLSGEAVFTPNPADIFPYLAVLPECVYLPRVYTIMRKLYGELHEVFRSNLADIRLARDSGTPRQSFADQLLTLQDQHPSITDTDVINVLVDFVHGGADTTAGSVAWQVLCLANRPALQEELYDEMVSVLGHKTNVTPDDTAQLPLLNACFKEILRYRPFAANSAPRMATESFELTPGVIVQPGDWLWQNLYGTLHNSDVYETPEEYNPHRWLRGDKELAKHWLPFGLGTKDCMGRRLAEREHLLCMAMMVRRFQLKPTGGEPASEEGVMSSTLMSRPFSVTVMERESPRLVLPASATAATSEVATTAQSAPVA